jgi:hypothetical protein
MFLRFLEIGAFLFFMFYSVMWFIYQWNLTGVKATEDKRVAVEKQAEIVGKSNSKHKNLEKKKKAVKKFKA